MKKRFPFIVHLILLLLVSNVFSFAQSFYWETPSYLKNNNIKFMEADSSQDMMAVVWQEYSGSDAGSLIRFNMMTSTDGVSWKDYPDIISPLESSGVEAPLTDLAVMEDGLIYCAVATDEGEVTIVQLNDQDSPKISAVIKSDSTILSPRIYQDQNGGLIVLVTMSFSDSISIAYTRSRNGSDWDELLPLVDNDQLRLNYLPSYAYFGENEYIVFQSRITDEETQRSNFQLFVTKKNQDASGWSEPQWVTDFEGAGTGFNQSSTLYDNQRVNVKTTEKGIGLVWERKISSTAKNNQIYYMEISDSGVSNPYPEVISSGSRFNSDPSLLYFNGNPFVFWYDNRTGQNNIVMGYRDGLFWKESLLNQMNGGSAFPEPMANQGNLYVLWENQYSNLNRMVLLGPDRSVLPPFLSSVNYPEGQKISLSTGIFRWSAPSDSSGIRGFSYSWGQDEQLVPSTEIMSYQQLSTESFTADKDGLWYLKVRAQDYAGNWSEPAVIALNRDTSPPAKVTFDEPLTDRYGNLLSNTFSLNWNAPSDQDLAGYSYSLDYLGSQFIFPNRNSTLLSENSGRVMTLEQEISYVNRIDGYWAFSVSAIDDVGNKGEPSVLYFSLDNFIPYTYVSYVDSRQDELGHVQMSIYGRGFLAAGNIDLIYIDRDQRPPWDYEFRLDEGDYSIVNDTFITGIEVDDVDAGIYLVGLNHTDRGLYFTGARLEFESTGTVKFGDFSQNYQREWFAARQAKIYLNPDSILFWMIIFILSLLVIVSSSILLKSINEGFRFRKNVLALISGEEFSEYKKKQRMIDMKKRGMGLRLKFTLSILVLVVSIVLIISLPLGSFMIGIQKESLVDGLQNRADVLLEGLASGAKTYLPIQNELELRLLPRQTDNIDEFSFATITGQGKIDKDNITYVWATNDEDIQSKYKIYEKLEEEVYQEAVSYLRENNGSVEEFMDYFVVDEGGYYQIKEDLPSTAIFYIESVLFDSGQTEEFQSGATEIYDFVSDEIANIQQEIDQEASTLVGPLLEQLTEINTERQQYIFNTDAESQVIAQNLLEVSQRIQDQISVELNDLGRQLGSFPELNVETLGDSGPDYIFYKPIIFERSGEDKFYRGTIRLGVSVQNILLEIEESQQQLIYRTGLFAIIALVLGLLGAFALSAITLKPIRLLVQGVSVIRDTEDKSQLKGHKIQLNSRDELAELADIVNQMTEGLVKASAANKDLTVGKDVQKMFIPLEMNPEGRKITTGSDENDDAAFFGYYEGAKGVSGDYFDFRKLDDRHYAVIKCDVAGKGVPASLIMVEVATIFLSYFTGWSKQKDGMDLEKITYRMNDLLEERGFKGRFAALIILLFDSKTGVLNMCNAGDNLVHMYQASKEKMMIHHLPESPATGIFPSMMVEMKNPYKQQVIKLQKGDTIFLFTDGIEEAQSKFRDKNLQLTTCQEPGLKEGDYHDNHSFGSGFEELGVPRIQEIVNAVKQKKKYVLKKHHDHFNRIMEFDFTDCEGTTQESVLAMVAVERVFRLYLDPSATSEDRVMVDKKIDEFLKVHFNQYREYFRNSLPNEDRPEYIYYTHVKEDEQFDDLTILGICKK